MSADKTLEERLADLTRIYVAGLPERLTQIEDEANRWAENGGSNAGQEILKSLHNSVHKLTGSASTYGFQELGDAARELEMACHREMGDLSDEVAAPGVPGIMALVASVAGHLHAVVDAEILD